MVKVILEIVILWFVIYEILLFFIGTRALQVLRGIVILLFAFFLFQRLGLERLNWLLTKLFALSVIAILIIFQSEIRQGLAHLGRPYLFNILLPEKELENVLKEIKAALDCFVSGKTGALIAIERKEPLKSYTESGVMVDATVSCDLLQSIFYPANPLHDGGVIIQQGRIAACGCLFPLSQDQNLNRIFGLRHRAAIGLSEETDAVVIIVSEERGELSLAFEGKLRGLKSNEIIPKIKEFLTHPPLKKELG
ncbi:MAG: TIGR00159 family protein [Candidatus Omnitrophica bacterium]|nr:TIGR00159 family protein [Candidatus Omnitrophota bacterium]